MSHTVDWRSAYREARKGITKDTVWEEVAVVPGSFRQTITVPNQDCFYASRETSLNELEICRISLQGDVSILTTTSWNGYLTRQRGNLFWYNNRSFLPVGHSSKYSIERMTELDSWGSTPGWWLMSGNMVYRPDGTREMIFLTPVGIYRNKPVPRVWFSSFQRVVGPHHFVYDKILWCRNLYRDGIASPEGSLEEQFFPLPRFFNQELIYSGGRLHEIHIDRDSGAIILRRSGVPY